MSKNIQTLFVKIQADFSKLQEAMERTAEAFRRLEAVSHDSPALPEHLAVWENEGGAL